MKIFFLFTFVILILNISRSISQTLVPAGFVSGTWTSDGSPYLIQGNIQIPDGSTLTIEPGVTVNFQGPYKINVQGRLMAIGTISDTIYFTAANTTDGWRGIRFENTPETNDSSKLKYCKLEYGKATPPNDNGGAIYFNNFSKAIISKCKILNCEAKTYGGAICCIKSSIIITYNTITDNKVTSNLANEGGAIYSIDGSPVITNNYISNNSATFGGGINCTGNNIIISNNTISYNIAKNFGGGIACGGNNIRILNNTISYNKTILHGGGGIFFSYTSLIISGNIISNNISNNEFDIGGGGGIYCEHSNPIIYNNTITNNTSNGKGGGIYCKNESNPVLTNITIAKNNATNGGAMYCESGSSPILRNTILWGNMASTSGAQVFLFDDASHPDFYYCDVQGGSAAFELNGNFYGGVYSNNLDADPLFVAPSGGSGAGFDGITAVWSLQNISPCIDEGDPAITSQSTDIAGNPRINVCRIDIGAYEYQTGMPLSVILNITQPILCHGASTGEITADAFGGVAPYSYLWSNGQTTNKAISLSAGDHTLTVSETGIGCSISKSITLTEPPVISIEAGTDKTIICGGTIQLDSVTSNYTETGNLTYKWSPSTGLNYDTIPNPSATNTIDTRYFINVSTPNGCMAKDSVTVNVHPLIATVNDLNLTCGNTAQLNVTTNYTGSGTLIYNWSPSEGLSADNISNPFVTLMTPAIYSVEVQTPDGCTATDIINAEPSVVAFNPSICMVTVNDSDRNVIVWQKEQNTAIDSFFIYRESSTLTGQYDQIGKLSYIATGIFIDTASNARVQSNKYKISVKDACGFVTEKSSEHKTMHLTINKGIGNIWNLIWEQYVGVPVSNYTIYRGTTKSNLSQIGNTSGSNNTYTDETAPTGNVYYQVEAVMPQACSNLKSTSYTSSRSNIISSTDVSNGLTLNSITELVVYPNPVKDKLYFINFQSSKSVVFIYDVRGKLVLKKQLDVNSIDISNLIKGIYTVKLVNSGNVFINKIIKE